MDRFSIALGSTQDWITAFNSMSDPEVDRAGIRLLRNKGTDRGRSYSNRESNKGK